MNFCLAETVLKSWLELIPNAQNVERSPGWKTWKPTVSLLTLSACVPRSEWSLDQMMIMMTMITMSRISDTQIRRLVILWLSRVLSKKPKIQKILKRDKWYGNFLGKTSVKQEFPCQKVKSAQPVSLIHGFKSHARPWFFWYHHRGFINIFSRRVAAFQRQAKLFKVHLFIIIIIIIIIYKKNFPVDGQTRWVNLSSWLVNFPIS